MAKNYEPEKAAVNELMAAAEEEAEVLDLSSTSGEIEIMTAPKVKLMVFNQDGPDGNQPIFVAVNGVGFAIPREMVVAVPQPVINALRDAVEIKYYREQDAAGQPFGPMRERPVQRYNFQVLGNAE